MRPVVGSTWAYDESLPMFGFDGDSGSNLSKMYLDPSVKRVILESLQGDVNIPQPTSTEDIYGFGKQAARLAQIAHIANNLLDNSTASSSSASGKQSDKRLSADDNTHDIAKNVLKQALDAPIVPEPRLRFVESYPPAPPVAEQRCVSAGPDLAVPIATIPIELALSPPRRAVRLPKLPPG